MTRIAFVGLALALTSACTATVGGGDDPHTGPGRGSDPGSGSDPSGSSVSPRGGIWTYGERTRVSTTCSASTPEGQAGNFGIDQVTPASFRVMPNDGTANFTCTTNSVGFSCPDRASFTMDSPGLDAAITIHVTATGKFSDSAHGTGRQFAKVDCTGTECALLGTFPCDFKVDFAIRAL